MHNPLHPANLADLLLRHDSANHKRETIAFSKRRQGAMERLAIWVVWRNYMKASSERRQTPTPAETLGLRDRPLRLHELLGTRLFETHEPLRGWLRRCYLGLLPTRSLGAPRPHQPRYVP